MKHTVKDRVVGVAIGIDTTTYALVGVRGDIIARESFSTTAYTDVNNFAAVLSENVRHMIDANGGIEFVRSVGIGAPSGNIVSGCIENSPNMPWKGRIPLASMLRDRLGIAVVLGNDVHAIAMGEYAYGVAHGMRDFIVVMLGNGGLGSCIYSNGRPAVGAEGYGGEFGHTCCKVDGRQCGCGNKGCLEEYVSARGLVKTANELLEQHPETDSILRQISSVTFSTLLVACRQQDKIALEAVRITGQTLGLALANYASIIDPEAIVLTGELVKFSEWMMPIVSSAFEENIFHNNRGKVELLVSDFDEGERDILGASALAWDVKEYSLFK